MARSRRGKLLGGPMASMRGPNGHGRLMIDPEAAPAVKLVFAPALNGCGAMRIAKRLPER